MVKRQKVSIVKYQDNRENIKKALEMSGCLDKIAKLNPSDKVLIKPNLVIWDNVYPFPKFGVITTAVIVEEMTKILVEAGLKNISIAEGVVDLSSYTRYRNSIANRYKDKPEFDNSHFITTPVKSNGNL
ncbi:MAG: DUF362 domain-containing protein [Dethiobacter sp.]|jgi:uncharacterized protein (DUF362 family)|nr:DUF362 domain-containing protein [Dethiobacter sp.]